MRKEDVWNFRVGQCGGCGLRMRFLAIGEARVTSPNCGVEHEIECGEMLDLTTCERIEVEVLVAMESVDDRRRSEQKN